MDRTTWLSFCAFALSALRAFRTELALWLCMFFLGVAYFQGAGKESDKESGMTDGEMGIETSEPSFPQGPRVCLPYQLRMGRGVPSSLLTDLREEMVTRV